MSGRLRTVWRVLIALAGFVVVQVVATVVVAVVFIGAAGFRGGGPESAREAIEKAFLWASGAVTLLSGLLMLGLLVLLRRCVDRRPVHTMGLVRPERRLSASVWTGLGIGVLSLALPALALRVLGGSLAPPQGPLREVLLLVPVLAGAAFNEEILCRGYLLQNFLDIRRPVLGTLVTATIFWVLHSLNPHAWSSPVIAVNLFGSGVLLALAYRSSGNIWFPTALHFGWNLTQGGIFGMPISGIDVTGLTRLVVDPDAPAWLTGGKFGLEGSVLVTVAVVAVIVLFLLTLRRQRAAAAAAPVQAEIVMTDVPEEPPPDQG